MTHGRTSSDRHLLLRLWVPGMKTLLRLCCLGRGGGFAVFAAVHAALTLLGRIGLDGAGCARNCACIAIQPCNPCVGQKRIKLGKRTLCAGIATYLSKRGLYCRCQVLPGSSSLESGIATG